ncbi:MAG: hypothetical protein AAF514_19895 [Verrucomicrobiota bacterium]
MVHDSFSSADEVEGRHLVENPLTHQWEAHTDWIYGAYLNPGDGTFKVGFHRHPFGDHRVEAEDSGQIV